MGSLVVVLPLTELVRVVHEGVAPRRGERRARRDHTEGGVAKNLNVNR